MSSFLPEEEVLCLTQKNPFYFLKLSLFFNIVAFQGDTRPAANKNIESIKHKLFSDFFFLFFYIFVHCHSIQRELSILQTNLGNFLEKMITTTIMNCAYLIVRIFNVSYKRIPYGFKINKKIEINSYNIFR